MKRVLILGLFSLVLFAFTGKPVMNHVKQEAKAIVKPAPKAVTCECTYQTEYYSSCQSSENAAHGFTEAHKTSIILTAVDDYSEYWAGMGYFYYTVVHYTAAHCVPN